MRRGGPAGPSRARARSYVAIALAALIVPAMIAGRGSAEPAFGGAIRVAGINGYEPGVDIAPDGTIFVNGPQGTDTLHSALARMKPDETSFRELSFGTFERLPGGFDSDVFVTPGPNGQNRVYFLDLWVGSDSVAVSENNGDTWSVGQPITTLPLSDRQWIAGGKRSALTGLDTLYAIYHFIQAPGTVMFSRSDDGGMTWPIQRALPTPVGGAVGAPGNLIADGDFVGFVSISGRGDLQFSWSTDGGLGANSAPPGVGNWRSRSANTFGDACCVIPSVAKDGDDFYATWLSNDYSIHVSRSIGAPDNWNEFEVNGFLPISAADTSNVFPWIAARGGKVALTWYSTTAPTSNLDPNAQTNGRWKLMYSESLDKGLTWSAPVCASCGNPNYSGVVKNGPVCTAGLGCDLSADPNSPAGGNRQLGDFLQIEIDAAGKSVIAFGDIQGTASPQRGAKIVRQL